MPCTPLVYIDRVLHFMEWAWFQATRPPRVRWARPKLGGGRPDAPKGKRKYPEQASAPGSRGTACAMGMRPNQGLGLEARKNWAHKPANAQPSRTPILSTAHARPKGPWSGAHAHGTRAAARREVAAANSAKCEVPAADAAKCRLTTQKRHPVWRAERWAACFIHGQSHGAVFYACPVAVTIVFPDFARRAPRRHHIQEVAP